jgi:hypothetical protein
MTTDLRRLALVPLALAVAFGLLLASFALSRPGVSRGPSVEAPVVVAPDPRSASDHSMPSGGDAVTAPAVAAGKFGPLKVHLPQDPESVARRAKSDKSDVVCSDPGTEPCGP